jgi:hypothetical protein
MTADKLHRPHNTKPAPDRKPAPARTWQHLFEEYEQAHQNPINRAVHLAGEPLIVASIPAMFVWPMPGLCAFAAGWAALWLSHLLFEKNIPASWKQPLHFLIGPIWVASQVFSAGRRAAPGRRP